MTNANYNNRNRNNCMKLLPYKLQESQIWLQIPNIKLSMKGKIEM